MSGRVEKALEEEQIPVQTGSRALTALYRIYTFVLLFGGLLWAMDVPSRLGLPLIEPEWLGPYLGVATAAAFLRWPYGRTARALDAVLGVMAIGCWLWLAINYASWMFDIEGYTLGKFIPGALGIVLMIEGVRKSCGTAIAVLLVIMMVYALLGYLLPRPMQADTISPELLGGLESSDAAVERALVDDGERADPPAALGEAAFRWQHNEDAMATEKLAEGIRRFADDQRKLEAMLAERLASRA